MQAAGHLPLFLPPRSLACIVPMGHRRHVFVVSLALLLVSATHAAGGHATQPTTAAAITQQGTDGVVGSMTRRSMVGSAPPSCEGKCGWWCVGRSCEAVQVPIEPPQEQQHNKQSRRHGSGGDHGSRASPAAQQQRPSSIDGAHSNYKPIIWSCQCVGAS